jgi:drug/metabolite transporter (DMT)-like permease
MSAANIATGQRTALLGFTLLNVCMQLASAFLLKLAPAFDPRHLLLLLLIMAGVLALNVTRFLVWGALHRRFPISLAYPASALFFPGVLAMAWWFGERVGVAQVLGAVLVLVGVALLLSDQGE